MRLERISIVILVTLGAGACGGGGGGGGGGPTSIDDLPEAYLQGVCETQVRCGRQPDVATCQASVEVISAEEVQSVKAAIDRGTVTYDADAAGRCLDAIGDTDCTWSDVLGSGEGPCDDIIRGNVALGGDCLLTVECVGGNLGEADCVPPTTCTSECCMGTCTAVDMSNTIAEGQPCEPFGEAYCVEGLYCKLPSPDASAGTCQAQVTSGPCDDYDACAAPLVCNFDQTTGAGECYRPAAEGATCDPDVFLFACDRFDDWCDPADMKCKKMGAPGDACDVELNNCLEYAWCMNGMCAALPTSGQPCADPGYCLGDLDCNDANMCVAPEAPPACTSAG